MGFAALLDAAIAQFGERGFDGASTREIARASGTAMSSITYHFGGKHGLYLAAADHIAERIAEAQAPARALARETAITSPRQAAELAARLLDSFADMMLSPASAAWSRFIVREQQQPTEAFERLYEGVMREMIALFLPFVQAARPDLAEREARAVMLMLIGQAIGLRVARSTVERVLATEPLDEAACRLLRAQLRATTLAILTEPSA